MNSSDIDNIILYFNNRDIPLPVEIVPTSAHYKNIRSLLSSSQWKKIRKDIVPKFNNCCQICGGSSFNRDLDLHEVWSYSLDTFVQKLVRFEALCSYCHESKHLYLSKLQGNYERALARIIEINEFSSEELELYLFLVQYFFNKRSKFKWKLDLNYLYTKYPEFKD